MLPNATVYTRDKVVMRKFDELVAEFPEIYKCIKVTDIDKTYSMPKEYVSYRKPRRISEQRRRQISEQVQGINSNKRLPERETGYGTSVTGVPERANQLGSPDAENPLEYKTDHKKGKGKKDHK